MALLGLLLLAAGLGGLLMFAVARRTRERTIFRRVGEIAHDRSQPPPTSRLQPVRNWTASALGRLRALFAFRMRRSWGISANPAYLLAAGAAAAAAVWLAAGLAPRLPAYTAPLGAALTFFAVPRIILVRDQRRSDAEFAALLPDAIDMVIRIVRAGLPVAAAIRTVGREEAAPLATVFMTIADQIEIGVPLDEALAKASESVGNPDFRFFAVAVGLQQSTGGNLTVTLETLSQIIRRRRAVRQRARAATAEVRISGIVLGSIPFVVTGALLLVAPHYLDPLFADRRGNVIIGLAMLGLMMAGLTMRGMIRNSLRT